MLQLRKVFNDPIHGHIDLSSITTCVIDTPQFQRMRDISQLGGTYYVYPGAASHRFEHCIGVAFLARNFILKLRENQPELNITDEDIVCIELAGLCHDLGHGPFSHLYDGKFLPAIRHNHDFQHEHASIAIFELMMEENNLYPKFYDAGLTDDDIHFIKELILGDADEAPPNFVWKGRGQKTFLYDIIANKRNGIDVDKFDYFTRDCWMLGVTKSFDSTRLMKFARVFPIQRGSDPAQLEICFHVKEAWNIFELFHTRYTLHKRAYQHRVCNAVELMIVEVLKLANDHIFIPGKDNQMRKMSECPEDYHAYWRLTEYILKMIENTVEPELAAARAMIHRLRKRDLFCFAGETILNTKIITQLLGPKDQSELKIKQQLIELIHSENNKDNNNDDNHDGPKTKKLRSIEIREEDLFCQIVSIGYGKGNLNPVSDLTSFYAPTKDIGDTTTSTGPIKWKVGVIPEGSISRIVPKEFEEVYIRVYSKNKDQLPTVRSAFLQWCEANNLLKDSFATLQEIEA